MAGVDGARRAGFLAFGRKLGLLFQIADDILDMTGTARALGKSPGKDASTGKLTYPAVYGLDQAVVVRDGLAVELARDAAGLEGRDGILAALAEFVASRDR